MDIRYFTREPTPTSFVPISLMVAKWDWAKVRRVWMIRFYKIKYIYKILLTLLLILQVVIVNVTCI